MLVCLTKSPSKPQFWFCFFLYSYSSVVVQKWYCLTQKSSYLGTWMYSIHREWPFSRNCREICTASPAYCSLKGNPVPFPALAGVQMRKFSAAAFLSPFSERCSCSGFWRSHVPAHAMVTASFSPQSWQHLLLEKSSTAEKIKHEGKFIFDVTLQLYRGWIWFDNVTVHAAVIHMGPRWFPTRAQVKGLSLGMVEWYGHGHRSGLTSVSVNRYYQGSLSSISFCIPTLPFCDWLPAHDLSIKLVSWRITIKYGSNDYKHVKQI